MTPAPRRVAIVGGGVSGALTAVHLSRRGAHEIAITLYERASREARGLAYDTNEPGHLLNVRASNMSALPDDPSHFEEWLAARPSAALQIARTPAGDFVPRELFGHYLHDVLQQSRLEGGCIDIRRADVVSIERRQEGYALVTSDGRNERADEVVLALGNLTEGFDAEGPVFRNPWAPAAVRALKSDRPVLVQGTGLTMIDTVVALRRHGFHGRIYALSRRGLLPHVHEPPQQGAGPVPARGRLCEIVRSVRTGAAAATAGGADWRQIIDALRPVTQDLWRQLSHEDRARFLRHVRPFWDVHRHRIAPPIAAAIERQVRDGRLVLLKGRIQRCATGPDGVDIVYQPRGEADARTLNVQRLIVATGIPSLRETHDRLVGQLVRLGLT